VEAKEREDLMDEERGDLHGALWFRMDCRCGLRKSKAIVCCSSEIQLHNLPLSATRPNVHNLPLSAMRHNAEGSVSESLGVCQTGSK
jgi:hypothetical protein